MKSVWCIYSSWWGNTRLVVDFLWDCFLWDWIELEKHNALIVDEKAIATYDILLLACPTYDHGVLHRPFEDYLDTLSGIDLMWRKYAVIWLWDDTYDSEYTCESAEIMSNFVTSHGGNIIWEILKIHKHPLPQLEDQLKNRYVKTFYPLSILE